MNDLSDSCHESLVDLPLRYLPSMDGAELNGCLPEELLRIVHEEVASAILWRDATTCERAMHIAAGVFERKLARLLERLCRPSPN